jgi:acyl carrier protein
MIYLWTLEHDGIDNASRVNQRLLYLIQTIIQQKWQHAIQFCLVMRDSKLQNESQQLDTLQHHLWNLADYFSREQQAYLISLVSLEEKTKLREQAKYIAYDVLNMVKTENHVCYTSNGRETKQLINPASFVAHESQQQSSSVKKIRSDVILEKEFLSNLVMNSLASLLGLEIVEIDPDVPYLNYGMDSIRGINFIANLNEYFDDLLLPMDLYRYPNVSQLVSYILNSFEPEIEEDKIDAAKSSNSMQSESEFMSEIADLNDAEVSKLLEAELLDIDNLLLGS